MGLFRKFALQNAVLTCSLLMLLVSVDQLGRHHRQPPAAGTASARTPVSEIRTQADVYRALKTFGAAGTTLVHMNRFMNLVEYFPKKEAHSAAFPLHTYDILSSYENGINSHNWLFVASQTGLVRKVIVVVPDRQYIDDLAPRLEQELHFSRSREAIHGYSYDLPVLVTTLEALQAISEPVVLTVDAGFFSAGAEPTSTARLLHSKFAKVAAVCAVLSQDETDITGEMTGKLEAFIAAFTGNK